VNCIDIATHLKFVACRQFYFTMIYCSCKDEREDRD
jgi:hypothetical protein